MSGNNGDLRWYVIHTYSGYENKVKATIEKLVENNNMQDQIQEILVPVQDEIEFKNGEKKVVSHKIYPGYVFLKMIHNQDTWYKVRNTRGVTSFVGPESHPVPLTDEEVMAMGIETAAAVTNLNFAVGDPVTIIGTAFGENTTGVVKEINTKKLTAKVTVSMFGREIPAEVDFNQIMPLD
jgi:transcriptional antiterminator NusG